MAVEVARQCFISIPEKPLPHFFAVAQLLSPGTLTRAACGVKEDIEKVCAVTRPLYARPVDTPPCEEIVFRYNPLHDMESLWWIATYFVLKRKVDGAAVEQHPNSLATQRHYAAGLFEDSENAMDARQIALTGPSLPQRLGSLHPCMRTAGGLLDDLRIRLVEAYQEAEKNVSTIDYTVAN